MPRAVRALHCAIVFPPSLPIRCVGDNDDRSIRRGVAWHRPRRAVGSSCSARHAIRAWRQPNEETTGDRDRGLHVAAPRRRWRRRWCRRRRPGSYSSRRWRAGEQHSCAPPGVRARVMRRPSPPRSRRFRQISDHGASVSVVLTTDLERTACDLSPLWLRRDQPAAACAQVASSRCRVRHLAIGGATMAQPAAMPVVKTIQGQ